MLYIFYYSEKMEKQRLDKFALAVLPLLDITIQGLISSFDGIDPVNQNVL